MTQPTRDQQIAALEKDWAENPRWKGIRRGYSAADVVRLRGSVQSFSRAAICWSRVGWVMGIFRKVDETEENRGQEYPIDPGKKRLMSYIRLKNFPFEINDLKTSFRNEKWNLPSRKTLPQRSNFYSRNVKHHQRYRKRTDDGPAPAPSAPVGVSRNRSRSARVSQSRSRNGRSLPVSTASRIP